jgi:putative ABC transport system permease protein
MIRIAFKMLVGDVGKFGGLLAGITFASFLAAFAACYFAGFMTRSFALVAEHPGNGVWVMESTTVSAEQFGNMPASVRERVGSVAWVDRTEKMAIGTADARLPDGRLQPFQIIGLDDATLNGAPDLPGAEVHTALRAPDAAIADAGGSNGKLVTFDRPVLGGAADTSGSARLLRASDVLRVNDHRIVLSGISRSLPRFPPRPLLYMSYANALRVLPAERLRTSFVIAFPRPGLDPRGLAIRIERQTGLNARSTNDFENDTVRWFLATSEDVGDIVTMLTIAAFVGFGLTAVMLYIFTSENLRQYAVLKAMGAGPGTLRLMLFAQSGLSGILGTGIGLGLCTLAGLYAANAGLPFRMVWWTPVGVLALNAVACVIASLISLGPVRRLDPASVFAGS